MLKPLKCLLLPLSIDNRLTEHVHCEIRPSSIELTGMTTKRRGQLKKCHESSINTEADAHTKPSLACFLPQIHTHIQIRSVAVARRPSVFSFFSFSRATYGFKRVVTRNGTANCGVCGSRALGTFSCHVVTRKPPPATNSCFFISGLWRLLHAAVI